MTVMFLGMELDWGQGTTALRTVLPEKGPSPVTLKQGSEDGPGVLSFLKRPRDDARAQTVRAGGVQQDGVGVKCRVCKQQKVQLVQTLG